MSSKSIEDKANGYLWAGKVRVAGLAPSADGVSTERARIEVEGSGPEPYIVKFDSGVWSCSCPAHVIECAHVVASMKIVKGWEAVKPALTDYSDVAGLMDSIFDKSAPVPEQEADEPEWSG